MNFSKNLLIEGWRGINHSFAMVNQYQVRELLKNDKFKIYFKDIPYFIKEWNKKDNFSGLEDFEKKISKLSIPSNKLKIDILYRISFPYRMHAGNAKKIFVFGTSEFQNIDNMIYQGGESNNKYVDESVKVVTPSHWSKVGFIKGGFKEKDIIVIPCGVDLRIFKPTNEDKKNATRKKLNINNENFVFLNVGAMTWNKGIDKLILAYCEIKKKYPFVKLIFKDQSNLYKTTAKNYILNTKKKFPKLINNEALSDIIVISKNLTLKDLSQLYGSCDAYISPYRAEGFNITALEAAACGIPVILTSGGSTDDYYHSSFALKIKGTNKNLNGNLNYIEPNLDSLISNMLDLIEKRNSSLKKDNAISFIKKNFTWELASKKLSDLFAND
tara:strand:+ start:1002 stop:2156 length:1155 start_codon:yes stop_codon:yes gene_type:complete